MRSLRSLFCRRALPLALLSTTLLSSSATRLRTLQEDAPSQCRRLTDADSPFLSGLQLLMYNDDATHESDSLPLDDPSIFTSFDLAAPELSQCIAQIDPISLMMSLSSPEALKCWHELEQWDVFAGPSLMYPNAKLFADSICPTYTETIVPCVAQVLVPAIEAAMSTSNGCCDAVETQINTAFGAPWTTTVTSMLEHIGNAFCAVRSSSKDGATSSVTCGDSLEDNWGAHLEGDEDIAFYQFIAAFQIPNDQVCQAAKSEPFVLTTGAPAQFGFDGIEPYGSCYNPMDALVQYVKNWPVWSAKISGPSTERTMSKLFGDGNCVGGADLVDWAIEEDSPVMKAASFLDEVVAVLMMLEDEGEAYEDDSDSISSLMPKPTEDASSGENDSGVADWDDATSEPSANATATATPGATPAMPDFDMGTDDDSVVGEVEGFNGTGSDASNTSDLALNVETLLVEADNGENGDTTRTLQEYNAMPSLTEIIVLMAPTFSILLRDMCFHIPNGVDCHFSNEWLSEPYPQSIDDVDTPYQQEPYENIRHQ